MVTKKKKTARFSQKVTSRQIFEIGQSLNVAGTVKTDRYVGSTDHHDKYFRVN